MPNLFKQFHALIPTDLLQVGDVASVSGGVAVINLPGGAQITARGNTTVGARVFVRGGLIEGTAPTLPVSVLDI